MSTSVGKIVAERNQRILLELASKPGNDICADCKARAPRWASYSLGIFICMSCASIHRKIGTHITKVKSITLDEWSKEQVEVMRENGNVKSNALYNPNEARHPPPTNMIDSERDSELEKFIRSKYEFKRFMDRKSGTVSQYFSAEPRGASYAARSRSTPLTDSAKTERSVSPGPPLPPKTPENLPPGLRYSATIPSLPNTGFPPPSRSASQPLPPQLTVSEKIAAVAAPAPTPTQPPVQKPAGQQVWEDLISLQAPSRLASLPLQYTPTGAVVVPFASQQAQILAQQSPAPPGAAPNPFSKVPLSQPHLSFPFTSAPSLPPLSNSSSSPALPFGAPANNNNPFYQGFSSVPLTNVNSTSTPFMMTTSSNPFSAAARTVSASTPTTPSAMMTTLPMPVPPMSFSGGGQFGTGAGTGVPGGTLHPHPLTPAPVGLSTNPFMPGATPVQASSLGTMAMAPPNVGASGVVPGQLQQQQFGTATHAFGAWAA